MLTVQGSGIGSRPSGEATSLSLGRTSLCSLVGGVEWTLRWVKAICSRCWVSPVSAGHSGTFLQIGGCCFFKSLLPSYRAEVQRATGNGQAGKGMRRKQEVWKSSFLHRALPETSRYFFVGGKSCPYGFGSDAATGLSSLAWTLPLDTADVSLCLSSELFHGYSLLLKFLGDPSFHLFYAATCSLTPQCVSGVCPCPILSSTHCLREYKLGTLSMWMNVLS